MVDHLNENNIKDGIFNYEIINKMIKDHLDLFNYGHQLLIIKFSPMEVFMKLKSNSIVVWDMLVYH